MEGPVDVYYFTFPFSVHVGLDLNGALMSSVYGGRLRRIERGLLSRTATGNLA